MSCPTPGVVAYWSCAANLVSLQADFRLDQVVTWHVKPWIAVSDDEDEKFSFIY